MRVTEARGFFSKQPETLLGTKSGFIIIIKTYIWQTFYFIVLRIDFFYIYTVYLYGGFLFLAT